MLRIRAVSVTLFDPHPGTCPPRPNPIHNSVNLKMGFFIQTLYSADTLNGLTEATLHFLWICSAEQDFV